MSQEILVRGLGSGVFSLAFAWVIFSRSDEEGEGRGWEEEGKKYRPYISGCLLPWFFLLITLLGMILYGVAGAAKFTLSMCFGIFLHISVYYLVLIPAIPLFRRSISARACAMLWMLPNYLYITIQSYMRLPRPGIVISAPGTMVWIIFFIWLVGFLAVFLWKNVEHLIFRRRVLSEAIPVTDPEVLSVWEKVIGDIYRKKPKFRLVSSPEVKTPLSVGLFSRTIRVILPMQSYRPEELELILRHELVHIAREDAWSKFFLVFCTAMCWFNPLMWVAMRKSAEDMELSCDETVLLGADDGVRREYAGILLNNAKDQRGFTTCLSASANAMRYRLKHIAKPSRRRSGALAVGLLFFVLSMTSGYVALAYGGRSGGEILNSFGDFSQYSIRSVGLAEGDASAECEITDERAFYEYLSSLTFCELTGNYSFSESERKLDCLLDMPDGTLVITVLDDVIRIVPLGRDHVKSSFYYITDGMDWEFLHTILAAHPAHYAVYASFRGQDGGIYEGEFRFDVGNIEQETAA